MSEWASGWSLSFKVENKEDAVFCDSVGYPNVKSDFNGTEVIGPGYSVRFHVRFYMHFTCYLWLHS